MVGRGSMSGSNNETTCPKHLMILATLVSVFRLSLCQQSYGTITPTSSMFPSFTILLGLRPSSDCKTRWIITHTLGLSCTRVSVGSCWTKSSRARLI
ncbi:hypothetical protein DL96DRAFT_553038 [Flagelloscypha sp. PMI_526]|nr:hypothetical protein DL96DRAFT_553038 [Flagelloscypha sp. PMI_526]